MHLFAFILAVSAFGAGVLAVPTLKRVRAKLNALESENLSVPPTDVVHYARRTSYFSTCPSQCKVVFLGDSRIEYADWNEVLATSGVANRGISGDTTEGVIDRLAISLPASAKICVAQAGVNDLWRGASPDFVRQNYQRIVRYIIDERQLKLLITSVVFVDHGRMALNSRIERLNSLLEAMCDTPGLHWLDLNKTLAPRGSLEPQFTDDGTHFTGKAYQAIAQPLQDALRSLPHA